MLFRPGLASLADWMIGRVVWEEHLRELLWNHLNQSVSKEENYYSYF